MPHGDFEKLTPAMVDALWDRLRAGEAAKPAARALGLCMGTVRGYLLRCGGIRPTPRSRGERRLSLREREEISRGLAEGASLRAIARRLGRAPSTISREVAAGGGRRRYRALKADERAWSLAARPKRCKLATNEALQRLVAEKLAHRWSPEQIAGWLKTEFPDDESMQVSHESIYRTLFVQTRGALRRELTQHLRTGRVIRRPKGARLPDGRGVRPGIKGLNISDRPAEAEDRAVPGHWEGDLVFGKGMSWVATLVERSTRYLMLVALPRGDHRADAVADALAAAIQRLPGEMAKSLTWDQGLEMAQHARFSKETGVAVYFCDPKSPWQRGPNETPPRFAREVPPPTVSCASTCPAVSTSARSPRTTSSPTSWEVPPAIACELNERPRQTLGWKTPSQALEAVLR